MSLGARLPMYSANPHNLAWVAVPTLRSTGERLWARRPCPAWENLCRPTLGKPCPRGFLPLKGTLTRSLIQLRESHSASVSKCRRRSVEVPARLHAFYIRVVLMGPVI